MTPWTPAAPPYADWNIQRGSDLRRITEDRGLRITEEGNTRIIERFTTAWTNQPTPANPWS